MQKHADFFLCTTSMTFSVLITEFYLVLEMGAGQRAYKTSKKR